MGAVIAVHGVGNRTRERFTAESSHLAAALAERRVPLCLAFWGHLAPRPADQYAAVPIDADSQVLPAAQGFAEPAESADAEAAHQLIRVLDGVEAPSDRVERIGRATGEALAARGTTGPPPAEVEAVVTRVLEDAVASGQHLALEPELAVAFAETIAAMPPSGEAFVQLDLVGPLRRSLGAIVDAVDASAARVVGRAVHGILRQAQASLSPLISTSVADILLYENDGARVRGVLDAEYERARQDEDDVSLAAHSLGALVAVEWLLGAPVVRPDGAAATEPEERLVRTLVSFGTQVSLFSEIRGLRAGDGMHGTSIPVVLPVRLERWSNVWHQLDPLAFTMGRVLQLAGPTAPASVTDFRLDLASVPTSADELSFHSSYWKDQRFISWAARVLAGEEE